MEFGARLLCGQRVGPIPEWRVDCPKREVYVQVFQRQRQRQRRQERMKVHGNFEGDHVAGCKSSEGREIVVNSSKGIELPCSWDCVTTSQMPSAEP